MAPNIVTLDRGEYTTCTVNLHGGCVTSWRIRNKEQVFVSRQAVFNEQNFLRGGISLILPRHGPWEFGPQHGFSRYATWTVEEMPKKLATDDIEAVFCLEDNDYTRSMWNYRFKTTNKITLGENELTFEITMKNTDKSIPFKYEMFMHTYIRVPDVMQCEVIGMKGSKYKEMAFENPEKFTQEDNTIAFREYINRCYEETPDEVLITNVSMGKTLKVHKSNFPELIIWNPWEENGKVLENFDPNEFMKMVSVEASCIQNPVRLEPGQEYKASLKLEVCDPDAALEAFDNPP